MAFVGGAGWKQRGPFLSAAKLGAGPGDSRLLEGKDIETGAAGRGLLFTLTRKRNIVLPFCPLGVERGHEHQKVPP